MRAIWTQDEPEFHGEFIDFDPIWSWPKPVQPGGPPIWIGANSRWVFDRVAEYADGWMPIGGPGSGNMQRLTAAMQSRGRDVADSTLPCSARPWMRRNAPDALNRASTTSFRRTAAGRRHGTAASRPGCRDRRRDPGPAPPESVGQAFQERPYSDGSRSDRACWRASGDIFAHVLSRIRETCAHRAVPQTAEAPIPGTRGRRSPPTPVLPGPVPDQAFASTRPLARWSRRTHRKTPATRQRLRLPLRRITAPPQVTLAAGGELYPRYRHRSKCCARTAISRFSEGAWCTTPSHAVCARHNPTRDRGSSAGGDRSRP